MPPTPVPTAPIAAQPANNTQPIGFVAAITPKATPAPTAPAPAAPPAAAPVAPPTTTLPEFSRKVV